MKNVIKDRDNEIESLKETIKLLKNKGEVNKLNDLLEKENKTLRNENKSLKEKGGEQSKENEELLKWKADHLDENTKLVQENETLFLENATLLDNHYIIKAKTNHYFRKLNNIDGDKDTHDLDQWLYDEDLERKHEDHNQEAVKQQNEEIKSDIIEIVKEEQKAKEQCDEINNSECFKILQYIHNILGIFINIEGYSE